MRRTPKYVTQAAKDWRPWNNMNDEDFLTSDSIENAITVDDMYDEARELMGDYMDEDIVEHMEADDVQQWLMETAMDARQGDDLELALEAKHTLYKVKAKLDRMYDALPSFPEAEKQWSKEELAKVLEGK
tara:strand:+ start:124 stop:513 length:390 start_codon:yes stop_codon:yes gene_type:complete